MLTTLTTEIIAQKAQEVYDEVWSHKPKDSQWPTSPYYLSDALASVLGYEETAALIAYVESLPAWDADYSEDAVSVLADRAGLDTDAYETYDDLWAAIVEKLSGSEEKA